MVSVAGRAGGWIPLVCLLTLSFVFSGCLVGPPAEAGPAEAAEGEFPPERVLLAARDSSWDEATAAGFQVAGADGQPVFGWDELTRNTRGHITRGHTHVEFVANWSGGVTGVIFGYSIDGGDVTWLPPAEQDTPQRVEVPPGAYEEPGDTRWRFYWEPSTEHTPGTGGWAGPGSLNRAVHAVGAPD